MKTLGFDIGGTFVKVGVLGDDGKIERETKIPTNLGGPDELVGDLARAAREFGPGLAAGVACAGIVNGGTVVASPNLPGWSQVDLQARLETSIGVSAVVLNDANAFVLAEVEHGAGRGVEHVVGLAIGTGVGGGLILGGRLWTGRHGYAGELGHVIVELDGPRCACGNDGCLEALIGTLGILRRYSEERGRSGLREDPAARPLDVFDRAESGEEAAVRTWEWIGRTLGLGLVSFTHILDPDLFIIGGGISAAGERLLAPARRTLIERTLLPEAEAPKVRAAALGNSAGWIGAAVAAREVG